VYSLVCVYGQRSSERAKFDYGVATVSRLLKDIGLFCRISSNSYYRALFQKRPRILRSLRRQLIRHTRASHPQNWSRNVVCTSLVCVYDERSSEGARLFQSKVCIEETSDTLAPVSPAKLVLKSGVYSLVGVYTRCRGEGGIHVHIYMCIYTYRRVYR